MNTEYIYAPTDVALIINLILGSHGGYLETPNVINDEVALQIMFHAYGDENQKVMTLIRSVSDCDKITAKDAVTAVKAYMGK